MQALFLARQHGRTEAPGGRLLALIVFCVLVTGCASRPYQGVDVDTSSFLQRAITQEQGPIRVTAAVPDADETEAFTGLDLYEQGIQPVWLKIENQSSKSARFASWSVDRNYFSPIEVAYMNRKKFSKQGYADMERWFYDNAMQRQIPPGETRSGLVFTNLRPGTKAFNLDVFSNLEARNFTFFVPMPGFTADYMEVDFEHLYGQEGIRDMDVAQLHSVVENELPCCATDVSGELAGTPLNVILVGSGLAVRRAMMRGEWQESAAEWRDDHTLRPQYFKGRRPDTIFYKDRADGDERIELRLWLAPWRVESEPVWVGQAFYQIRDDSFWAELAQREQFKDSAFLASFMEENVAADLDSAKNFVLQNFWYNQSLRKMGQVGGIDKTTIEQPGTSFTGLGYFSSGYRLVMVLSETPMGLDEVELTRGSRELEGPGADDV